jgi:threonylcarbamoyladenosine tRNA methylthiotransferase MtaB
MKVAFYTFGCKLNQYETESLADSFQGEGFELVTPLQAAEIYIINTCTVTSKSEQKARKTIRALANRNPSALIIITGCYAQVGEEALVAQGATGPGVVAGKAVPAAPNPLENVVIVPQADKAFIHDFACFLNDPARHSYFEHDKKQVFLAFYAARKTGPGGNNEQITGQIPGPFAYQVENYAFHSRAFLKIQDGCDYACTYCRVPLARGRAVSLEPAAVMDQVRQLDKKGYREVVLTGVNITAYRQGDHTLPLLLKELLLTVQGLRVRLSSLEPEKITPELCEVLAHPSVCPHFHIPIQSGSDRILAAMRRRYNSRQLEQAILRLKQIKPGAFFAADIIVGFPGENEADFMATYRLVQQHRFAYLHVFPFSPRPGTVAYDLQPRVHSETVKQRVRKLVSLSDELSLSYLAAWRGKQVTAVLETQRADAVTGGPAVWEGLSENYLKLEITGIPAQLAGAGQAVICCLDPDQRLRSPYPARYSGTN